MTLDQLRTQFYEPADEFSPLPFWFWNDHLTESEITRQIHDFKDKGVMGFIIHPRIGIPHEIEYLSDRFMELVRCAVETAAELGMKVILYDEAMYPSGSAHGKVVASNPQFASIGLQMREYPVSGQLELTPELEEDEQLVSILAVKKLDEKAVDTKSIRRLELTDDKVVFAAPDQDEWAVLVFVETYSRGTIRGIHFGEDDGQPGAPAAADLLNPEAVRAFINFTHERYYEVLSEHFGTTIIGMFTDEPAILGRRGKRGLRPWTRGFLAWYEKCGGSELDLPALWFDTGSAAADTRRLYKQAINKLMEETYYKQISDWCAKHGIALTGHPERSADIGLLKYFHIPGQDVVWRWVAPENDLALSGEHSTQGKCSSDAARHAGLRRNSNECFACCGPNKIDWAFSVWDMKWYMDWLFVRGVNLLYPHAFFYSIEGEGRYNERPPDVGPNNIWWPHYRTISDYMKRNSWLNTDSVNQAQVAVLCEHDHLPWEIVRPLYEQQIEFNYLENTLFADRVAVENGRLKITAQSYPVLLVEDSIHITPEVQNLLPEFIKQGGILIVYNPDQETLPIAGAVELNDFSQVVDAVEKSICRDLAVEPGAKDLRFTHVVKNGIHFYLLVNEGDQALAGKVTLGTYGCAEQWDAWNGTAVPLAVSADEDAKTIAFELSLPGRGSTIIAVDPNGKPVEGPTASVFETTAVIDLSRGWEIENPPVEMGVADSLRSWTEFAGMERFSGTLTYIHEFSLEQSQLDQAKQVVLDLGEVCELVTLEINGRDAGVRMLPPYQYDLTEYAQAGVNQLRVKITNTLANKFTEAKIKSGLLGPVVVKLNK